jgi:hypothetical protein
MLSGEATNTNFIVFGLTRPMIEPKIYRIRGEHANHYTTDAVINFWYIFHIYKVTTIFQKITMKSMLSRMLM